MNAIALINDNILDIFNNIIIIIILVVVIDFVSQQANP